MLFCPWYASGSYLLPQAMAAAFTIMRAEYLALVVHTMKVSSLTELYPACTASMSCFGKRSTDMTSDDLMQGQRIPWASPPGAEASTPGALLYHDRTPASPLNMLLLNRQPAQQTTPTKEAHSAAVPSPHQSPHHPSAQRNGNMDTAQPDRTAEPLPGPLAGITTDGNTQQAKATAPAAEEQATQANWKVHPAAPDVAAPAGVATAPEALQHSSPAQPAPAQKPKGKGFLGAEVLVNQQSLPEKDQGNSTCNQLTEHQNGQLTATAYQNGPTSDQPGDISNGPSSKPAQAKAGQQSEAVPQQRPQEPAINKHSKQSTQTGQVEASRQSPDLEIASVHQAVEAVQVRSHPRTT